MIIDEVELWRSIMSRIIHEDFLVSHYELYYS
jgi:hypothetical protein